MNGATDEAGVIPGEAEVRIGGEFPELVQESSSLLVFIAEFVSLLPPNEHDAVVSRSFRVRVWCAHACSVSQIAHRKHEVWKICDVTDSYAHWERQNDRIGPLVAARRSIAYARISLATLP